MNDMTVGLLVGIVTATTMIFLVRYGLAHTENQRQAALQQRIADAEARTAGRGGPEDRFLLGDEPLDDITIAYQAALGIHDITQYLKKEAGQ